MKCVVNSNAFMPGWQKLHYHNKTHSYLDLQTNTIDIRIFEHSNKAVWSISSRFFIECWLLVFNKLFYIYFRFIFIFNLYLIYFNLKTVHLVTIGLTAAGHATILILEISVNKSVFVRNSHVILWADAQTVSTTTN